MASLSSSLPLQIAETLQTASLNRAPSPAHDLNPSTAASSKQPVRVSVSSSLASPASPRLHDTPIRRGSYDSHDSPGSIRSHGSHDSPRYTTIRPIPRKPTLPPLPDLRFEQSYLASLQGVEGWRGVAYVTVRDQVLLPLLQGTLWTLLLAGWRHWNRGASFGGASVGSKIRRWWWGVNNWAIPEERDAVGKGVLADEGLAEEVKEFYQSHMNSGGD